MTTKKRRKNAKSSQEVGGAAPLMAGLEIFGVGFKVFGKFFLQGFLVVGRGVQGTQHWLGIVNRDRWGPVLIQWFVLFVLGYLAGYLYAFLV